MQSGISVSQELQSAFRDLLSSNSQRGLLISISKSPEALVPSNTITSTSSNFSSDLSNLEPHIKEDAATYVLLRESLSAGGGTKCIAVTYVPERAPVRSKMLFASTRLTLLRELGTEHFTQSIFATAPAELTASGWQKHEAHTSLSAPLTAEEEANATLRETEALESTGTSARSGGHVSKSIALPLRSDAVSALEDLKSGSVQLVQLAIDIPSETLILASTTPELEPSTLGAAIEAKEPRYSFYMYKSGEGEGGGLLFIYTCPSSSSIKQRMLYAASRASTLGVLAPQYGLEIKGKLEASDPEDVTEVEMLDALGLGKAGTAAAGPVSAGRGGFAKPKRPGRR